VARKWTDRMGKYTIQAEFVDFKDGKVQLRQENGKEVTIPIEKLSDADRQFVQQQSKGKPVPEGPPKKLTVDLSGRVKMEMVLIPADEFKMGDDESGMESEKPVHKVNITKPFYLGKYEVTQEQWEAVMGNNPSHSKGVKNPVEQVTWDDCQKFLVKLDAKTGGQGDKFVLPTEAQWEYACRAGSTSKFCFGDDENQLDEYAWYDKNSGSKTHPVGEKKPNAWGLYDMHGNVWEWCQDWYGVYGMEAVTDPSGPTRPTTGSLRVIRGGGWYVPAGRCRSAGRDYDGPGGRRRDLGLRVARVPADK
jgi:formylglycine-generating enzyme required for sulfatase activity